MILPVRLWKATHSASASLVDQENGIKKKGQLLLLLLPINWTCPVFRFPGNHSWGNQIIFAAAHLTIPYGGYKVLV